METHHQISLMSEAIREGAKLKPQEFHWLLFDGGTCPAGAALDALGVEMIDGTDYAFSFYDVAGLEEILFERFPYLRTQIACPVCQEINSALVVLNCLNDNHGYTREQVADWLQIEESGCLATTSMTTLSTLPSG